MSAQQEKKESKLQSRNKFKKTPPWRRVIWESLTALIIGVVFAFLLPQIVGEEFSTRGKAKLYAPFAGQYYDDAARDQTSVLLIDSKAIKDAGEIWPPQYAYHARLLRALGRYQPSAVFLDIYFAQTRDDATLAQLRDVLCSLRKTGTHVFLGAPPDEHETLLRPELEELVGTCFEKVALQYSPDSLDRLAWTYPLKNVQTVDGKLLRSAALAIYEDTYKHSLHADVSEMALTWGLRPADSGLRWSAHDQAHDKAEAYCRRDFGFWELAPIGFKKLFSNDAEKPVCVFHPVLYAYDLKTNSDEEEARLKQGIQGKVVMIGTALGNNSDLVSSPLQGRIPGVFLHAMALDNLLVFGDDYRRDIHLEWPPEWNHMRLYGFLILCLGAVIILPKLIVAKWRSILPLRFHPKVKNLIRWRHALQALIDTPAGQRRTLKKTILHLLFILLGVLLKLLLLIFLACVLVAIGQEIFNIGLMSVVDVIFFALAAEWFEWNKKFLEKLKL